VEAIAPKPRLSPPAAGQMLYPSLGRGITVNRVNQVGSAALTAVRLAGGCVSLVAVIAWFSRSVLAWALSLTMAVACGVEALEHASRHGQPERVNTEQGAQLTSLACTARLKQAGRRIRLDGGGRALDHGWVARWWRRVKDEEV
jgi:putative transposase